MRKPNLTVRVLLAGLAASLGACVGDNPDGGDAAGAAVADAAVSSSSGTPVVVGTSSSSGSSGGSSSGTTTNDGGTDAGSDAAVDAALDSRCSVQVPIASATLNLGCGSPYSTPDVVPLAAGKYNLIAITNGGGFGAGCAPEEQWQATVDVEAELTQWVFHVSLQVNGLRYDYHFSGQLSVDQKQLVGSPLCGGEVPLPTEVEGHPDQRSTSFRSFQPEEGTFLLMHLANPIDGKTRLAKWEKQ